MCVNIFIFIQVRSRIYLVFGTLLISLSTYITYLSTYFITLEQLPNTSTYLHVRLYNCFSIFFVQHIYLPTYLPIYFFTYIRLKYSTLYMIFIYLCKISKTVSPQRELKTSSQIYLELLRITYTYCYSISNDVYFLFLLTMTLFTPFLLLLLNYCSQQRQQSSR